MENRNGWKTPDFDAFKEKAARFLRDNGIYVVLLVCALLVGTAAILAFAPSGSADKAAQEPSAQQGEDVSSSTDERLEAARSAIPLLTATPELSPTPEPTPTPTPIPDKTPPPAATPKPAVREKASAPLSGKVQWDYAVEELIYSKTLNQWMTHAGVDIAAPKGTEVHAVWAGTVESVSTGDMLGVTVEVSHANGLTTVYANLRETPPVEEGQKVNARALIGFVGDTARAECGEAAHLHFEVIKNGKNVNPLDYVLLLSE